MRYQLVAIGRMKDAGLRAACDGYLARLRHYTRVEEVEVRDAERILPLAADARLVALSRTGEAWTSRELSLETSRWELGGRDVVFAVGGADSLPASILEVSDRVWSLSPLTLPHELARVVVLEQLYRAYTIRRGEPYHRGP